MPIRDDRPGWRIVTFSSVINNKRCSELLNQKDTRTDSRELKYKIRFNILYHPHRLKNLKHYHQVFYILITPLNERLPIPIITAVIKQNNTMFNAIR